MSTKPPIYLQLGRTGDLIALLPAFQKLHETSGVKPTVATSREFAGLLEGVSCVHSLPLAAHWWLDLGDAIKFVREEMQVEPIVTQPFGVGWGTPIEPFPNFMASMWHRAGFTVEEMLPLQPKFDRRHPVRERHLIEAHDAGNKPLLLVHLGGVSFPFPHASQVQAILNQFSARFHIVDLGRVRSYRFYDLLGLMERAVGMVLCDSAPLHLAGATDTPYFGYTNDGWRGAFPKGNCVMEKKYADCLTNLDKLKTFLESLTSDAARLLPIRTARPGHAPAHVSRVDDVAMSAVA